MKRAGLLGALALVVLVNAAVLGGVAWNRLGPLDASLRLTERELPIEWDFDAAEEDTGLALELNVNDWRVSHWLGEAKLRELGFRTEEYGWTKKQPLQKVYLVLEFNGPAWLAAVKEWTPDPAASRLMAVDAGQDARVLRQRYADPNRYLILAAEVGMEFVHSPKDDRPTAEGFIKLLNPRVHVPLQHRAALEAAVGDKAWLPRMKAPRYEVVLNVGARHEPWIGEVKPR